MTRRKQTDLAKLMNRRGVSAAALAHVTGLTVEDVEAFQAGTAEPDADAAYLIGRALDGSHRARLALDAFHHRRTRSMVGEGAEHSGVTPPYGTADTGKLDGERVPSVPPLPSPTPQTREPVRDGERYGGSQ